MTSRERARASEAHGNRMSGERGCAPEKPAAPTIDFMLDARIAPPRNSRRSNVGGGISHVRTRAWSRRRHHPRG
ncbi:hypothetical protein WG70_28030 [Burkholderia oklahomensis EO147]|nr:hypothetical protein WG70_28030 [Burkholderia oklahomensis EO147]AOI46908.1 hypothetical protein WI23_14630 [Burkholderia oklahomensis C6786]KUY58437.1 hypothetical protein WI23_17705 [Burkholderia oklahomensis C6786]KUY64698.1 hypothetical protein WG70_29320 [Burkholderia oklahomensis EO147]